MRPESESGGQEGRSFIEEARRRQIVQSAVEVIADAGYGNASLARIARHAGISKGVISYHFDGKDDLMSQVVVQLYVRGGEAMGPRVEAAEGFRNKLRIYVEANLRFLAENVTHVGAMTDVVLNLREPGGELKFSPEDGEPAVIAPLVDILRRGQAGGEFGAFDPEFVAMLIRDAIDGAAGRMVRNPAFDLSAHAEQMWQVFDRATRAPGEEPDR